MKANVCSGLLLILLLATVPAAAKEASRHHGL